MKIFLLTLAIGLVVIGGVYYWQNSTTDEISLGVETENISEPPVEQVSPVQTQPVNQGSVTTDPVPQYVLDSNFESHLYEEGDVNGDGVEEIFLVEINRDFPGSVLGDVRPSLLKYDRTNQK